MKTRYKYINFEGVPTILKTKAWICRNNKSDDVLGKIQWYSPWRQYCYFSVGGSVYNPECLSDIKEFLQQVKDERN